MTLRELKNYLFIRYGRQTAWIVVGSGVLFGVFMRLWVYSRSFYMSRDSILYLGQAKELLRDPASINQFSRPPLFQWLWSRLIWRGLPEVGSGVFLAFLCGIGVLILIYPLCRELKLGRTASVLTVWLAAANPQMVKISIEPLREAPYIFTLTAVLLLLMVSLYRKNFYWAQSVAAMCGVLCLLSRIEGAQLWLFWISITVIYWIKEPRRFWRRLADTLVFPFVSALSLLVMCWIMGYEQLRIFKVVWGLTVER